MRDYQHEPRRLPIAISGPRRKPRRLLAHTFTALAALTFVVALLLAFGAL